LGRVVVIAISTPLISTILPATDCTGISRIGTTRQLSGTREVPKSIGGANSLVVLRGIVVKLLVLTDDCVLGSDVHIDFRLGDGG